MRDAETEHGKKRDDRRNPVDEERERRKEGRRKNKGGGVDERQTTLAAEEKVESMKLVVLAAPSIREKYPEGTTVGVSSPLPLSLRFYSIIMQMPK